MRKLIKSLNEEFKDDFIIRIVGDFDIPEDELEAGDDKYVQICDSNDGCYIDWLYEEFNEEVLLEWAEEVPEYQGSGDDDISKEYLELSEIIKKVLDESL